MNKVQIPCCARFKLERAMGIEPTLLAWEAKVLPLNYTRLNYLRLNYIQGDKDT
jgi:hypothetical protein